MRSGTCGLYRVIIVCCKTYSLFLHSTGVFQRLQNEYISEICLILISNERTGVMGGKDYNLLLKH